MKRRRGTSVVEMAFALPVLFVIVFGLIEVGHSFLVLHAIQDAARAGCRVAICPHATNADVLAKVDGLLQAEGFKNTSTTVLLNNSPQDVSQAATGDVVCVQVVISAADVSLIPNCPPPTGDLHGSFQLRIQ